MSNFLGGDGFTFLSGGGGGGSSTTTATPLVVQGKICSLASGVTNIDSTEKLGYAGVSYQYVISDCHGNKRSGFIQADWYDLTNQIEFYDTCTLDIGNTAGVVFSFSIVANFVYLVATLPSADWTFSYFKIIFEDCCTSPYTSSSYIITEGGDYITSESGDFLVTE